MSQEQCHVNVAHENKYFEFHIKVRRSLMLFIITEGCFAIILTSSCSDYSVEFISFNFEV